MIEGVITLSKSGSGKLYGRIVWEAESNGTVANTSEVTARIQLHRPSGFTTTGTWKGSLNVGGKTVSISYYGSIGSSWVTVKTLTVTVNHNADGSGTCYIYGKVTGPSGTSIEGVYVSGSQTITLEKIARYATIVSVPSFTDEENPLVTYANPAGETVEFIEVAISTDGETPIIAYRDISIDDSSYAFLLTDEERNILRSATPNSNSVVLYVMLRSAIDGVSHVNRAMTTLTIVNAKPILNPQIVDINAKTIELTGDSSVLIAVHSVAQMTVNASAQKQASIESIRVEHGSQVLKGDGVLNITNDTIKITVVDSRGNITTHTASNTIIPYINPTCVIENSVPNALGELPLYATGKAFDSSFGKSENAFSIKYRVRETYGDYGEWIIFDDAVLDGFDFVAETAVVVPDYRKAYVFQVAVFDSLNPDGIISAERTFIANPIFHWGQNDFAFTVPVYYLDKLLEDWFLNKAGDTMLGNILMGGNRITGLGEPLVAADAVTKAYADNYAIYKVWVNPTPAASLSAKTLPIDLSPYQWVAIKYRFSTSSGNTKTAFGCVGDNLALDGISTSGYIGVRVCQTSEDSVHIENATYSANVDNKQLYFIPLEIYGIKGVVDLTAPVEKSAICGTFLAGELVCGQ